MASGSMTPDRDKVRELAYSLSEISETAGYLETIADSSRPDSDIQQDYKNIAELCKKLDGTPEFEKWKDEHPLYWGWIKVLKWFAD